MMQSIDHHLDKDEQPTMIDVMSSETERSPVPLRAIHINLESRAVIFEAQNGLSTQITLSPEGLLYALIQPPLRSERAVEQPLPDGPAEALAPGPRAEKASSTVVTGRLKTQPKEGRPDNQGHPTAWARLAVHEEGLPSAHLYSATFHRASRRIALTLAVNDQITVEGYPHPSGDPAEKRLDTLSIFRFLNYPGQPARDVE